MDAHDIFKKITVGVRFDLKRFRDDAVRFRMVKEDDAYDKVSDTAGIGRRKRTVSETSWKSIESNSSAKYTKIDPIEARKELGSPEVGLNEDNDSEAEDGFDGSDDEGAKLKLMSNLDAPASDDDEDVKKKRKKKKKKGKKEKGPEVGEEEQRRQQHVELMNRIRNENRINVLGTDIPDPVQSFSQLVSEYGVKDFILRNASEMGYHAPTPIQMQAIPLMLQRRELLACAPTGSGKTAAFLIPLVHHLKEPSKKGIRALIVAPTRELAAQIQRECVKLSEGTNLRCHQLDNIGKKSSKAVRAACSSKCDILVSTPNRLIHLLNRDPCPFSLKSVEWLIVDESDKLFEAGMRGFRDQLATIYKACSAAQVRRAMFSATFAFDVEEWCKLNLDNVVMTSVGARNTTVDTVQQELLFVGEEYGKLLAFRDMVLKGFNPPVLVFVQSKDRAKELFKELIYDGVHVDVMHSDLTQLQRDNVVREFRMGKIWVLICTELMGRGIDFKGVNLVINYDFPPSTIAYIHRIGRTGRAGRAGRAITYVTRQDFPFVRSIAQVIKASGGSVPDFMLAAPKTSKDMKKKLKNRALERDSIRTILMTKKELKLKKREAMKKKGIVIGDDKKEKASDAKLEENVSMKGKTLKMKKKKKVLSTSVSKNGTVAKKKSKPAFKSQPNRVHGSNPLKKKATKA